jgi:tryptophan synthase alpha chain
VRPANGRLVQILPRAGSPYDQDNGEDGWHALTISEKFDELKANKEKALILFVTAGDPPLEQLPDLLSALQEGGADIIEVGVPFSDPIADGPTIQASSQRALDRGVTPTAVYEMLAKTKLDIPVVAMGYYNTVLRVGLENTAKQLKASGVEGTIMSDLTPEEADDWLAASKAAGLDNIFLAAPTSTDVRLDEVCHRATGFVYAVSRMGVTGAGQAAPPEVTSLLERIKARTKLPVCAGFGISQPEHVKMVCQVADGAVIGSALVDFLSTEWNEGKGRRAVVERIREWKAATKP